MRTFIVNRAIFRTQAVKSDKVYTLSLSCRECMYSRDVYINVNSSHMTRKNICILFKNNNNDQPYVESKICRSDENLCGENGEYFKSKNTFKVIDL
jgi:hypothetical protein